MPYPQAVIKEGLRIGPPGTGLVAKQEPPKGDTVGGVLLPGGTSIGTDTWAIVRNPGMLEADANVGLAPTGDLKRVQSSRRR